MRTTQLPPAPFEVFEIRLPRDKPVAANDAGEPSADLFADAKRVGPPFKTYEAAQAAVDLFNEYLAPRVFVVAHRGRAIARRTARMDRAYAVAALAA